MLAQQSQYLQRAYETLEEISADQEKRIAYTARQKALYDYNTLMEESFERGVEQTKREMIIKFYKKGESPEQLADDFEVPLEQVNIIIKDIKNE